MGHVPCPPPQSVNFAKQIHLLRLLLIKPVANAHKINRALVSLLTQQKQLLLRVKGTYSEYVLNVSACHTNCVHAWQLTVSQAECDV